MQSDREQEEVLTMVKKRRGSGARPETVTQTPTPTTSARQWTNVRDQTAASRVSLGDHVAWDNDRYLMPGVVEAFTDHPAVVVVRLRDDSIVHWSTAHPRFRRLQTPDFPNELATGMPTHVEDAPAPELNSGYYESVALDDDEEDEARLTIASDLGVLDTIADVLDEGGISRDTKIDVRKYPTSR